MNRKSARFRAVDVLLIAMMILPLVAGMALKILTTPASEGIEISGARIYFTIPMPLHGSAHHRKSQVNGLAGHALRPGAVPVSWYHGIAAEARAASASCWPNGS